MKIRFTIPYHADSRTYLPGWVIEVGCDTGRLLVELGHVEVSEETRAKKNPEIYVGASCNPDATLLSDTARSGPAPISPEDPKRLFWEGKPRK